MAQDSRIEWTQCTWNPVTGCTKISAGCANCYAERMARRLKAMGCRSYRNGFRVTLHPTLLKAPLHWKRPRMVFVNSMSDLFHEDVPYEFILRIYRIMQHTEHQYQILTKRSQRLHELGKLLPLLPNVCLGVTVESAAYVHRIDHLRATPAAIRFLSLEPLLSPIHNIDLSGIDWVIVGGESGPGARPVEREWIIDIRDRCLDAGVPFFFKQWGGVQKKKAGRQLDGRIWDEMPENLKRLELSYA